MRRNVSVPARFIACWAAALCCLFLSAGQSKAASAPGPDGFGYLTTTTNTYDWVDISSTGTSVSLSDDSQSSSLTIGFSFNFYGIDYTDFAINSNGNLVFGNSFSWYNGSCTLPSEDDDYFNYIALMADDLDPGSGGDIYYQSYAAGSCPYNSYSGACLVVQFQDIPPCCGDTSPASTFEGILLDDDTIVLQYNNSQLGAIWGHDSLIGIEGNNFAAGHGLTYACDSPGSLSAGLAVAFGVGIKVVDLYPPSKTLVDCAGKGNSMEYGLHLYNNGSNATFTMSYVVTSGNATLTGPATVSVADNSREDFQVTLTADAQVGDVVTATVTAAGANKTMVNDISMTVTCSTFEPIADAPTPKESHVAAAYDGKIWSIAGDSDAGDAPVEVYDPATNSWQTLAGSDPPFGDDDFHSGCQAGDTVYMWTDDGPGPDYGLYSYNMATNTWSDLRGTNNHPDPTLWSLRDAAWVYDSEAGFCIATGGEDYSFDDESKKVFVYQPSSNSWLPPLPDFSTRRDEHAAWIVGSGAGRMLCIAGGDTYVDCDGLDDQECDALEETTDKTTQCLPVGASAWNAENTDISELPVAVEESGYAKRRGCKGEQLWLVGGATYDYSYNSGTGYYDVAAGSWVMGPLLSEPTSWTEAVVLDNELYQFGGETPWNDYSSTGNRLVPCKSCFSWPMFMPAIIQGYMQRQ